MSLFQNKYRIEPARLKGWDYSIEGFYFITICTKNRECFFGDVMEAKMVLSEIENLANLIWQEIPIQFPNTELDGFVIMTNHVHGIIVIKPASTRNQRGYKPATGIAGAVNDIAHSAPHSGSHAAPHMVGHTVENMDVSTGPDLHRDTGNCMGNDTGGGITGNYNPMFHENISRFVRWYKGRVSFECRKINPDFSWQSRFYGRIIRDDGELRRVRKYIIQNPFRWEGDVFFH